jgi:hypothetical protein
MRTSSNELIAIENQLFKTALPGDQLLFEANLIINPGLKENLIAQQQTYRLIKAYGRKQLKAELEAAHQTLFSEPVHQSFAQKIRKLFHSV